MTAVPAPPRSGRPPRFAPGLAAAALLTLAALAGSPTAVPAAADATRIDAQPAVVRSSAPIAGEPRVNAASPTWSGGLDVYRPGTFTTQKTWTWCTAASVQIARNIVDRREDHTRAAQSRYFSWMRRHDRYAIPLSDGVDPAGWTAGMREFVDGRYRLVSSGSFDAALRSADRSLRLTRRPVGLFVAHGDHAWLLTGFTATADPARTASYTITSVRVVGPLYGLQSRNGYDMRPDTRLTPAQLRSFFTPWHYARIRMVWEGRWLAIEAIGATNATSATNAKPVTRRAATSSDPVAADRSPESVRLPPRSRQPRSGVAAAAIDAALGDSHAATGARVNGTEQRSGATVGETAALTATTNEPDRASSPPAAPGLALATVIAVACAALASTAATRHRRRGRRTG